MISFNYHHLFYFYTIAKPVSITKACDTLRLAHPYNLSMSLCYPYYFSRNLQIISELGNKSWSFPVQKPATHPFFNLKNNKNR